MLMTGVVWYLAIINVMTFIVYAADKAKAVRGTWRVREQTLLFLAAVGGSVGALAAMIVCHHKVRKARFVVGVPVMLAVQVAVAVAAWMAMRG